MGETTPEAERQLLLSYLNAQRDHALGIVEGLDDEAMRRPVLPSGWSCLGMISHLTLDEEQFWFRGVVAADPEVIGWVTGPPLDCWTVGDDVDVQDLLRRYRAAIAESDAIIKATPLDAPPAWWPGDLFGDWRLGSLREIMLHMITEIACHAGHLDAARELLDGRQWLVLTD